MTAQDVIDRPRQILQDTSEINQRFLPSEIFSYINDAQQALEQKRPDLLLATDNTLEALPDVTAGASTIPFPNAFREALAEYVAACGFAREHPDTYNLAASQMHRQRFEERT